MKRTMKKVVAFFATVALMAMSVLGLASCGSGDQNYAAENNEFYIGCSGPLSGPASVYGIAVRQSADMAVEEINAAGGINGVKLKFVMMDDKHDSSNVAINYASMYEAGMQMGLGCVTTQPCKEFKTLSYENNLFFLTPSATADTIVEYDNAYQMCFADTKQGVVAAQQVNASMKGQTIGVLYRSDDAYSTGILQNFKENLDPSITLREASFSGDVITSFSAQINTLKDVEFIFMPIYYAPAAQFMTEAKNTISPNAVYYGCDGLDGIDTSVDNFDITTIPQEVSFLSHFNSKATEGASATYIEKYRSKYGEDTLNQFGASAYDCVYALATALTAAGDKVSVTSSPSDICEALKTVFQGDFVFSGVTGSSITWDEHGFVKKGAEKYIVKEKNS